MQGGTLHIAFSLFSIFYKATSISSYVDQFGFLVEEALWKMENIGEETCKVPLYMLV